MTDEKLSAEQEQQKPKFKPWQFLVMWFAANLVLAMLVNFIAIRFWTRKQPIDAVDATTTIAVSTQSGDDAKPLIWNLEKAELLLKSHDFINAASAYRKLLGSDAGQKDFRIRYQYCLCLEMQGHLSQAAKAYQQLNSNFTEVHQSEAAQLGYARVLTRLGKSDSAKAVAYSILLRSANERTKGDAFHLLAGILNRDISTDSENLLSSEAIVNPTFVPDLPDLLSIPNRPSKDLTHESGTVKVLDRFSDDANEIHMAAAFHSFDLTSIVQVLCGQARVRLEIDPKTMQLMNQRTATFSVADLDLSTLLDAILNPYGIDWSQSKAKITLHSSRQTKLKNRDSALRERADRMAVKAVAFFPENPSASASYLLMGNRAFAKGEIENAISLYSEITRRLEKPEILTAAWFNLAKCFEKVDRIEEARNAYFRVVDQSTGKSIAPIAFMLLGRSFLENGKTDEAIKQLVRGYALASAEIKHLAALTLANAYILNGNPEAANSTLMEIRDELPESALRDEIAFASAFARYQTAKHERSRNHAGRVLTTSLARIDSSNFFTHAGYLIAGAALAEIGLVGEQILVYKTVLENEERSVLKDQIIYALADLIITHEDEKRGYQLLSKLAKEGVSKWAGEAQLRLARLASDQQRFQDCLDLCYRMIASESNQIDRAEILRTMGRVFERLNDHQRAAICFAGMVPVNEKTVQGSLIDTSGG